LNANQCENEIEVIPKRDGRPVLGRELKNAASISLFPNSSRRRGRSIFYSESLLKLYVRVKYLFLTCTKRTATAYSRVSQPFLHGGTPKIIFHIPRNPYL
jgi:hypothetical protein